MQESGMQTNVYGDQLWYQNGELHRDNDLPAHIWADGSQFWWKNGKRHRDGDLPAAIYSDGSQLWYQNANFHRDNGLLAIIWASGRTVWYQHGEAIKDAQVRAELHARILYENSRKVVLVYAMEATKLLPLDIEMVICNY